MTKRKLSKSELEAQLSGQLGMLQRTASLFDQGYEVEARRMSVILRVLLHTGRWPSLLKQLGLDQQDFWDGTAPYNPDNLLVTHSLVALGMDDTGTNEYIALLDDARQTRTTPFEQWWRQDIVFSDAQQRQLTRADIVRTAADQDGGAHVDPELQGDYAAYRHEDAIGWQYEDGRPLDRDPVFVAIRQISHEVLKTLVPGYSRTMQDALDERKPSEIAGGKMRFFPHSKQFWSSGTTEPIVPGRSYVTEVVIDSITTGSVRMVVNSALSEPYHTAGKHTMTVVAGQEENTGVFGEYTDAVVDRVSLVPVTEC